MTVCGPKLDASEEAALLERILNGTPPEREAAYEQIFSSLREPVYALCLRLTGNTIDAEDALQDAFVAAFRGLSAFRGDARISTWLYRIAVREALRQKRRHAGKEIQAEIDVPAPETTNPAIRKERVELFNQALDRLSADHRTVLAMFTVEGLSHDEIADALKIPTGTIWSRLHKARKKLAAEIKVLEQTPRSGAVRPNNRRGTQVHERERSHSTLQTILVSSGVYLRALATWAVRWSLRDAQVA